MEIITVHEHADDAALDETVRALFQLQSQALKAAQQQIDELRRASDNDARATPFPTPPSHDASREVTVAAIAQLEAKTKKEVEQDEPAATHDRVRKAVIALLVIDCMLVAITPFTGGVHGEAYQVRLLFVPLTVSGVCVLFFGMLDSSAMAVTAMRTCRTSWIVQGALIAVAYALEGEYALAAFYLIFCWFSLTYYGAWWFLTVRERVRTRFKGKLAERAKLYTARVLEIASVQMALLVQGLAQGIGPHSSGRNRAIYVFSTSLVQAWFLSMGVYDAGEVDTALRAARLRLSFRESAALAASMLCVLTGLAGYVMAEQDDPDAKAMAFLGTINQVCLLVAAVLTGSLIKNAKKKEQMCLPVVPLST